MRMLSLHSSPSTLNILANKILILSILPLYFPYLHETVKLNIENEILKVLNADTRTHTEL